MQHCDSLEQLQISTAGGCGMSWQHKRSLQAPCQSSSTAVGGCLPGSTTSLQYTTDLQEVTVALCCNALRTPHGAYLYDVEAGGTESDIDKLDVQRLMSYFASFLSEYSSESRPTLFVLQHISSCHLDLYSKDGIDEQALTDLLRELKCLKHLGVSWNLLSGRCSAVESFEGFHVLSDPSSLHQAS